MVRPAMKNISELRYALKFLQANTVHEAPCSGEHGRNPLVRAFYVQGLFFGWLLVAFSLPSAGGALQFLKDPSGTSLRFKVPPGTNVTACHQMKHVIKVEHVRLYCDYDYMLLHSADITNLPP